MAGRASRTKPPAGRSAGGSGERVGAAVPLAANPFAPPTSEPDPPVPVPVHTIVIAREVQVFRAYGHVLTERGWEKE